MIFYNFIRLLSVIFTTVKILILWLYKLLLQLIISQISADMLTCMYTYIITDLCALLKTTSFFIWKSQHCRLVFSDCKGGGKEAQLVNIVELIVITLLVINTANINE